MIAGAGFRGNGGLNFKSMQVWGGCVAVWIQEHGLVEFVDKVYDLLTFDVLGRSVGLGWGIDGRTRTLVAKDFWGDTLEDSLMPACAIESIVTIIIHPLT